MGALWIRHRAAAVALEIAALLFKERTDEGTCSAIAIAMAVGQFGEWLNDEPSFRARLAEMLPRKHRDTRVCRAVADVYGTVQIARNSSEIVCVVDRLEQEDFDD